MKGFLVLLVIASAHSGIHQHRANKRQLQDQLLSLQSKKKQLELESKISMTDVIDDIHRTKADLSETKRAIGKHTMYEVFLKLILPITVVLSAASGVVLLLIPRYFPSRAYHLKAITGIVTLILIILVLVWYHYHAV